MAKIRARKETGKLYIDFFISGVRFREQTLLEDNGKNRKVLEKLLASIEAKLVLNEFKYENFFPNSNNIAKAAELGLSAVQPPAPSEMELEKGISPNAPTFKAFAEQWFDENRITWRVSHTRNIESLLDSTLLPAFGRKKISSITKADILGFRAELAKKPGRGGNKTISAKTLNNQMAVLRSILEEAADRFDFDTPYKNIKPLKLQKKHIEPFTLAEVNQIIKTVREDYRNYYIVRFFTGMRTGEIDGLKWKFVDFDRRQILVRETLIHGETEYTKTNGSQREIPMLGPVFDALKEQFKATGKISEYVFCNQEGKPLEHNNVTKRVWYPLLNFMGLEKRRPYQTRHTAATLLLASGENPEWVARVLGHSSTEMLFKVYSRYIPNATRQDGSAFNGLLEQTNIKLGE